MSTLDDIISAINWPEALLGLLFAAQHGGARRIWIDRRQWSSPGEAETELNRLRIPISGRMVRGHEAGFLVSTKQAAWAEYVLKRKLANNPVPAWTAQRPGASAFQKPPAPASQPPPSRLARLLDEMR